MRKPAMMIHRTSHGALMLRMSRPYCAGSGQLGSSGDKQRLSHCRVLLIIWLQRRLEPNLDCNSCIRMEELIRLGLGMFLVLLCNIILCRSTKTTKNQVPDFKVCHSHHPNKDQVRDLKVSTTHNVPCIDCLLTSRHNLVAPFFQCYNHAMHVL